MTTTCKAEVATALTQGNAALSINFNRRNRGRRMTLDLSDATLKRVLEAYQVMIRKTRPRYRITSAIAIIEEMEEFGRRKAEATIREDGTRDVWAGPFMPEDVDAEFWAEFEIYYISVPSRIGKQRHSSSAETYANHIIGALRWSAAYGASLSETFSQKKFGKYKKKKVTPTDDMISLIYHYDLDGKENRARIRDLAKEMKISRFSFTQLKKVRDHFVFNCSNGQRISDSKRMTPDNITGTVYETTQQKTGNQARVDLRECAIDYDVVEEILDKYNHYAPAYMMDTGVYNRYLHLLCRSIGGPFDRVITWGNKILGEVVQESAPFWKRMTSHVARSKYATKQIQKNKTLPQIMSETGHSDVRNMNKYYAPESH